MGATREESEAYRRRRAGSTGGFNPFEALASIFAPSAGATPVVAPGNAAAYDYSPQAQAPRASAAFTPPARGKPPAPTWKDMNSYLDPRYDRMEAAVGAKLGVPPEVLKSIRVNGERSNADQTSSAGAKGVYQFWGPTREAFMKQHGIDPWKDPATQVTAAAMHLKESFDRTGSWEAAAGEYNGGQNWQQKPESRSYVERFKAGLAGQLAPPVNAGAAYAPVFGALGQAQQQALTPWSAEVARAPMPELPAPPDLPSQDFSAQEALLAQMAPQPFGQEQQKGLQRQRLWQGAAQALASLPEGAGVGSILAKVGAGMLGGRLSADDEIQRRADQFDEKMLQYNMLKLNFEDRKSQSVYQEALQEAQLGYNHAMKVWDTKMTQWGKDNTSSYENGQIVTKSVDANGNLKITGTPIAPIIKSQFALKAAEVQGQIAQVGVSDARADRALVNAGIVSAATMDIGAQDQAAMLGGGDPATGAITASAMYAHTAIESGAIEQIMPGWTAAVSPEVQKRVRQMGYTPDTTEFAEKVEEMLVGDLTIALGNDPKARAALMKHAPLLTGLRTLNDKRQTRRDAKGRTTTTVTEVP